MSFFVLLGETFPQYNIISCLKLQGKIKWFVRKHQKIIGRVRKSVLISITLPDVPSEPAEVNSSLCAFIQSDIIVSFPRTGISFFVGLLSQALWKVWNKLRRYYSTSSWAPVKQSTLCEANIVTKKALDLAAHQLHIFVGFCCVGITHSKLVMSLSSSHVILCGFLSCNKYCNSRYTYIVVYCFTNSWILMGKKTQQQVNGRLTPWRATAEILLAIPKCSLEPPPQTFKC